MALGAALLSLMLQIAVIYVPFLQQAFSTVSLRAADWLLCAAVGSSVLWFREASKALDRALHRPRWGAVGRFAVRWRKRR